MLVALVNPTMFLICPPLEVIVPPNISTVNAVPIPVTAVPTEVIVPVV